MIRDASEQQSPYIIALTANVLAEQRAGYLRSGMDDFLSKPIDVDLLERKLNAVARRQDSRSSNATDNLGVPQ